MKNIINITFAILLGLGIVSCGGDSGGDTTPTPPDPGQGGGGIVNEVPEDLQPDSFKLIYPLKDKICTTGEDVPGDDSKSSVEFKWEKSTNAKSYTLTISNLNNPSEAAFVKAGIVGGTSTEVTYDVVLNRNVQYDWKVEAINKSKKAESATWNMYNAGITEENYAPFPAKLNSPANESTVGSTSPTVEWEGSDVDNDIASFDILVDTVSPPVAVKSTASKDDTSKQITGLASGTKYYWQVVTTDDFGNKTKSEVQEFTTP